MQVARATILELARGVSTGAALWGAGQPCPPCAPVVHCPAVPATTCVCAGASPLAVAGAVALLALVTVGAYVLGAVWGLPTREVRKAPLPASAVVVREAPTTLEEQARAQLSFIRNRSTAQRA